MAEFQRLFLWGFSLQLGSFLCAIVVGMATDPFHAASNAALVGFLGLLIASVVGTIIELVAMHRRESYIAAVARRELSE